MVDIEEPIKRMRKRVVKKEAPDHVYSVNGIEGENLDTKAAKKRAQESAQLFSTPIVSEAEPAVNPFPKHRGRKSKAELEYLARLAEEASKGQTAEEAYSTENEYGDSYSEPTTESVMENTEDTDIQDGGNYEASDEETESEEDIVSGDIIARLQEKMNAQNVSEDEDDEE